MNKKMQQAVFEIYGNMNNIFLEDEDKNPVQEIETGNLTEEFFIATLIAFKMQFEKLTGQTKDIIEFTHLLNSLAIQFIMDKEEGKNNE